MDEGEEVIRGDGVLRHEARQRGAKAFPICTLGDGRFRLRKAAIGDHIGSYSGADLFEKSGFRRIQRIIEVEKPRIDGLMSHFLHC
jgi:hypothetical protein